MTRILYNAFIAFMIALFSVANAPAMAEDIFSAPAEETAAPSQKFYQITVDQVQDAVAKGLEEQGAGEAITVSLQGASAKLLYQSDKPLTLELKTLQFDEAAGRWSANLLFKNGDEVLSASPIAGRYDQLIEVPTLKERVRNGDVITAEDIGSMKLALSRKRRDMILSDVALIGKTPRRTISPGRPIRADEIAAPSVIAKGATVDVYYHMQNMQLQTTGEALQEGGVGDSIRVKNSQTGKIIQGVVESATKVRAAGSAVAPVDNAGAGNENMAK